jgi:hypothetical protein
MGYYHATICRDGDAGHQVVVHWDDNDPNRFIYAPIAVAGEVTEQKLADAVATQGWRIVSFDSDNVGRGWAIVARSEPTRPFYDPISQGWCTFLTDDQKRAIAAKYPDAVVPGVRKSEL